MRTRVLVVVRMAALRRVMTDVLEAGGYAAFGCDGMESAGSILSSCAPDVAIVDDHLPDGSSADLVRFLRSQSTADGRPVLVLALATWASFVELTTAGAHCVVWKPAAERELLTAVRWLEETYERRRDGRVRAEPEAGAVPR